MLEAANQCRGRGLKIAELEMDMRPRATCFSQSVRSIGDKLVAEAVCGLTNAKLAHLPGDEIFDRERTDSNIQALVVKGLSGSGVYAGDQLIGLVSVAHKCSLTGLIESEFTKAISIRDARRAALFMAMHSRSIAHPLLNIHQIVTEESVAPLLS